MKNLPLLFGESLRLTKLISTRMACPDLEAATTYKLAGGKLLARFEPR